MKKSIKFLSLVLAVALFAISIAVTGTAKTIYQTNGYSYSVLSQSSISICGWDNRSSDLVIPRKLDDLYVAEIDDTAFRYNTFLTSVDLTPATLLEKIGVYAFNGCENLAGNVVFSGRLHTIGESAFEDCSSLTGVYFYTTNLSVIPAQCFKGCSLLDTVILPDNLTQIEKYAFAGCTSLTEIIIPDAVNYIAPTAFDQCDNLVIYCNTDSYAHQYAIDRGIEYVLMDTPEPTEPPTEPTGYYLGDTDNNEAVDTIDATWIQRYTAAMDVAPVAETIMQGDVDGDDDVTIIDATFILRYSVNIATPYQIGEYVYLV